MLYTGFKNLKYLTDDDLYTGRRLELNVIIFDFNINFAMKLFDT